MGGDDDVDCPRCARSLARATWEDQGLCDRCYDGAPTWPSSDDPDAECGACGLHTWREALYDGVCVLCRAGLASPTPNHRPARRRR